MRIIITSGPSYEPLDHVRRLTNFSTGELGTLLAEAFAAAGHSVVLFRGAASTFAPPLWPVEVVPFTTNASLESLLQRLVGREDVNIVFHAAALCDFRVRQIHNEKGETVERGKMSSRGGALQVTLEPLPKLLASMRRLFPASILVGWKYEVDGTPTDVSTRGREQIDECLTDACVLNGGAYGSGYGLLSRSNEITHLSDKAALCKFLVDWAERIPMANATPRQESFHALATFMPLSPFI